MYCDFIKEVRSQREMQHSWSIKTAYGLYWNYVADKWLFLG